MPTSTPNAKRNATKTLGSALGNGHSTAEVSASMQAAGTLGAARLIFPCAIEKLGPVDRVPTMTRGRNGRKRRVPRKPFVAATYASIEGTCGTTCPFKGAGCYAQMGYTRRLLGPLDSAAALYTGDRATKVIAEEARLIIEAADRWGNTPHRRRRKNAKSIVGVILRLHISGDVRTALHAMMLADAAEYWLAAGGGPVFTFTHSWRDIPPAAFGAINVMASVETVAEAKEALSLGYAPAIVIDRVPRGSRAFNLDGLKLVPCPAQSRGSTCVACRLCVERPLHEMGVAIAFKPHGPGARLVREAIGDKRRRRHENAEASG
jgi:hypothetical protein